MGGRGLRSGMKGVSNEERKEEKNSNSYTLFKDKASGGWDYEGTGSQQIKFFQEHSNYDSLISSMSDDEKSAFHYWTSGYFMSGQQYKGFENMHSEEQRLTRIYDKYLDNATLNKGLIVTRLATPELVLGAGAKRATLEQLQAMKGRVVITRGSMSCGVASQGLTIGSDRKGVEYRIHIPKGSTGAGMWIGDSRINGWGARQREFMTNRDISFKVGKTEYDKSRDVYVVNLKYEGRLAHDYGKK